MKSFLLFACCTLVASCAGTQTPTNTSANANASNTSAVANTSPAGNSTGSREYPRETADAFLESCEEAGSTGPFCTCVFEKVQAKYTFEEFSVIESNLVAGNPPKEFVEFTGKARAECTK